MATDWDYYDAMLVLLAKYKGRDLANLLNDIITKLCTTVPLGDSIAIHGPNGIVHVSAAYLALTQVAIFTFAVWVAVHRQERWGYVDDVVGRGREAALKVWKDLTPDVLDWGSPAKCSALGYLPSHYVGQSALYALYGLFKRNQAKVDRHSVSTDTGGRDDDGSTFGFDLPDPTAEIELKLVQKDQIVILEKHFTADEISLMRGDVKQRDLIAKGMFASAVQASRARKKLLKRASKILAGHRDDA